MPFSKFVKIYLMPPEHGGWFLLLGPFLLGALAAARPNGDLLLLVVFAVAVYVTRQPLTILLKALTGRRTRSDARPALRALGAMGAVDLALLAPLLWRGHWYLLWLGIPAGLVLTWQMFLTSRRAERNMGIELVGSGTLALTAPAAYWVSVGQFVETGLVLWFLAWLYAASSIVYVYLRLKQRRMKSAPARPEQWLDGRRVLVYAGFALALTVALAVLRVVPVWAPVPYALALGHYVWGITHPCVAVKPARVGIEQSLATLGFYVVLGLAML